MVSLIISIIAEKDDKTSHDWVKKVIHWELCMKFEFDRTNKLYIFNKESILRKETQKVF